MLVVAYALSPIDLIPDFIPVLGLMDDLLILPLGIWLAIRLVPVDLWQLFLRQSRQTERRLPASRFAAVAIVCLWVALISFIAVQVYGRFGK